MSLLGKPFGSFLSSYALMIPVVVVFFLMALSLFWFFTLRLPARFHTALVRIGGAGYTGAFSMGLVAGMIASPCTGPMLAALLAVVAVGGSLFYGTILLFSYALGLGTLFFVVAVFALVLPKPGAWMDSVKSLLGILMVMVALYFLRNLSVTLQQYGEKTNVFLVSQIALVITGVITGGVHLSLRMGRVAALRKMVGLLSICAGGFGLLSWYVTPPPLLWNHEASVLDLAKRQGRPVLIDFSADWCFSCVQMETKTFASKLVQEELSRFYLWKVDCSIRCKTESDSFGVSVLPTLVIIDASGHVVDKIEDFVSEEQLIPRLQQVK